ncbi:MAG: hypothetical protein Q8K99_13710 [Actinomycetota bacterium]|nr:hypothetical protein [Actinomycetota bacterium]
MARSIRRKGPFARLLTTLLLLAVVVSFTGIGSAIPAVADGNTSASQEATTSPPPVEELADPVVEAPAPEAEESEGAESEEAPVAPVADSEPAATVSSAVATVTDRSTPPALPSVPLAASSIAWDYVPPSSVTMEGYSRHFGSWVHSNLKEGYVEGEWITFRLKIENSSNTTQAVPAAEYWMDYKEALAANSAIAIDDTFGWSWYVASSLPSGDGFPSSGLHSVTPEFQDVPVDGDKGLVTKLPEIAEFLIPPHSVGAVYFEAHLAITEYWQTKATPYKGASFFNGASAQARLWAWHSGDNIGQKAVPFPVGAAAIPDSYLEVTKYNDLDGDGDTSDPDPKLTSPAFTFKLKYLDPAYPFTLTATTADGVATFSKLPPGDYELSEVVNGDWVSTNLVTPKTITIPRTTTVQFSALNFIPRVELEIEKTADRDEVAPGEVINYTLRYRNTGNTTARDVSIVDDYDETLVTPTGYAPATDDGDELTWDIGDLPAGTSWHVITYSATVIGVLPTANETVHNRADIRLDGVSKDFAVEDVRVIAAPRLHITKVASVDVAVPGQAVSYMIEYWNDGSTAALDVAVMDVFAPDDALLYSVLNGGGGIPGPGGVLLWPIGPVAADGVHHSLEVVIRVADILPGFSNDIDNTASISMNQQVVDQASEHVDIYASSELSIEKSVLVSPDEPGDEVTYLVEWYNNGTTAATDVTVEDTYDTDYVDSVVDADGGDDSVPGTITWDVGTVAAKSGGSVTYTVKLKDVMPAAYNEIFNTAAIFEDGEWVDEDTEMVSVDAAPDWSFDKVAVPSETVPGGAITYTLYYTNSGSLDAENVSIEDDYDQMLVSVFDANGGIDNGDTILFALGTVPADGVTRSVSYTVTAFDYMPEISNYVINYADLLVNRQIVAEAEALVRVPAETALDVDKTADKIIASPGETVTYTVNWSNTGGSTSAHGVWISDDYDQSLAEVVSTDGGADDGDTIYWYLGDVAPDATGSFTYQVKVKDVMPEVTNTVHNTVSLYQGDALADQAVWDVSVDAAAELHISKSADAIESVTGGTVTYSIDYRNTGTTEAKNVRIVDDFSNADAGLFAITDADGGTQDGDDSIEWLLGDLAAGASGTLVVTIRVADVMPDVINDIFNEASIYEFYENFVESDDWTVDVDASSDLSFEKTADKTAAQPGELVTYTLSWANAGDTAAKDVEIVDNYDEALVDIESTGGGTDDGDTITWDMGTLPAGGSGSVTYTARVHSIVPSTYNVVHNDATLLHDGDEYPDDWDVDVDAAPILSILKEADKSNADPGDQVTYTVSWFNDGNTAAENVTLDDVYDTTYVQSVVDAGGGDTSVPGTITWDIGTVAAQSGDSVTYTVKLRDTMPDNFNVVHNVATLHHMQESIQDYWDVYVAAYAEMTYMKTGDKTVAASGDEVEYTISYRNDGQGPALGVLIVDDFADADAALYSILDVDGGGLVSGDEITWDVGDVAPDGVTHELHVTIQTTKPMPSLENDIYNIAYFYEDFPYLELDLVDDLVPEFEKELVDTHDWNVDVPEMDLSIAKASDVPTATALGFITYTVTYKNESSVPAKDFTVTDDYDETLVDVVDAAGAVDNGDTLVWTVGTELAAGATGSITYVAQVKDPELIPADVITPLDNDVVISHPDDWDENNNTAEATVLLSNPTTPFTPPDLTIEKSADKTKAKPGDKVTYTLTFKNVGDGPSQGFKIVDDYDERYATVVDAGGGTVAGGKITWNKSYLAAGESGKVTYVVKIDETMPDGKTNVDNVVVIKDPNDRNPDNDRDTWRVVVGEPFLPFTGGSVLMLLMFAMAAIVTGFVLRRAGRIGA